MKKEEFKNQPWFPAIKGSQRDLIREAGGIDRVSLFLKCSTGVVGNWNNWELPDLMPQWAMIALEADLGRAILSGAYARLTGATVLDPVGPTNKVRTLMCETAFLMHEVSEFISAHSEAFEDGEYSLVELRDLRAKTVDIETQAVSTRGTIDRKIAALQDAATVSDKA